jgi:hypothetical protein
MRARHFDASLVKRGRGALLSAGGLTSPAWKLPPRSEMLSCRCSSPKSARFALLRPHSPSPRRRDHLFQDFAQDGPEVAAWRC